MTGEGDQGTPPPAGPPAAPPPPPAGPPPPPAGPPPAAEPPQRTGWRKFLFSWKAGLTGAAALVAAAAGLYSNIDKLWPPIRGVFVPADAHVSLLHCRPEKILVELTNPGGRPVTVDPPEFTIESALGPPGPTELQMSEFVRDDPSTHYDGIVNPGDHDPLAYSSLDAASGAITPFFSDEERQRGGCTIHVSVPVRGQATPLTDSCPCGR
jgi:hypothetical protein